MPNPATPPSILLVGCGRMGSALVRGWRTAGMDPSRIVLIDPRPDPALLEFAAGLRHYASAAEVPANLRFDIVIFAVKPQVMDAAIVALPDAFTKSAPLFVSVAAGKTLAYFSERLGKGAAVIRAMPNTPALIGKGITVLCASASTSEAQRHEAAS